MRLSKPIGDLGGQGASLAAAAAGGALLAYLHVPGGWLTGAMAGVIALSFFGAAAPLSTPLRLAAMTATGVATGSAVSPQMLAGLADYPISLALMIVAVCAMTFVGALWLARLPGWSPASALLAAVPGALSYVFALGQSRPDVDLRKVAVVQVCRILFVMAALPLAIAASGAHGGANGAAFGAIASNTPIDPPAIIALVFAVGALVGLAFERAHVAAGMLLGAMAVSAVLHGVGFAAGRLPPLLSGAGQILVGAWIGGRFIDFDWAYLGRSLVAAIGGFAAAMAIAALFAFAAGRALGLPFAETFMAFSPGGLEAMTFLAFALGLDPLYVSAHHLARFMFISAILPFVLQRLKKSGTQRDGHIGGDA